MSDLQFQQDDPSLTRHLAARAAAKKTPSMVRALITLRLAKDEKSANWQLVCLAIIFFLISGVLFLMAAGFNFSTPTPSSGDTLEIQSSGLEQT